MASRQACFEGRLVGIAEEGYDVSLLRDAWYSEFDVAEGSRRVVALGGEGEGDREGAMDFTPLVWLCPRWCHERAVPPGHEGEEEGARRGGV